MSDKTSDKRYRITLTENQLALVGTAVEGMMNDLISRKALCDYALNQKDKSVTPNDIMRFPSAQPEQRWIPCSERLPKKEEKTYWVCTDTEYQCECRWTNNRFGLGEGEWGWSIFDTPQYSKPIAWMPLPEPYREERTEE